MKHARPPLCFHIPRSFERYYKTPHVPSSQTPDRSRSLYFTQLNPDIVKDGNRFQFLVFHAELTRLSSHKHEPARTPLLHTHKQTLPREPQPTSHTTRTFTKNLLFTSLAHAQTNIASRTSTNITCHTNIPHNTSLHLACSRTNKHCLANLNQHHMPHEHSS